ncbi:MAG: hypothetical protein L7T26_13480, partial [Pseudomonadales bacterium]|nr:hypothetical protein [Pseudomonadales bacterium]
SEDISNVAPKVYPVTRALPRNKGRETNIRLENKSLKPQFPDSIARSEREHSSSPAVYKAQI